MATNVIVPAPYDKWLTLKEAAKYLGYQPQYTRALVKDGKIGPYATQDEDGTVHGARVKLDMGSYQQWRVNPAACDEYKATVGTGGGFGGGNIRRFTFRFNPTVLSEEDARAKILAAFGDPGTEGEDDFVYEFAPAWTGKSKSKKKAQAPEETKTVVASIVAALTQSDDEDDEDEYDDDEYDDDEDPLA